MLEKLVLLLMHREMHEKLKNFHFLRGLPSASWEGIWDIIIYSASFFSSALYMKNEGKSVERPKQVHSTEYISWKFLKELFPRICLRVQFMLEIGK